MADVELWTVDQVAAHLGHHSPGSSRRWLAQHGVTASGRDVDTGAKLYRADDVRGVARRPAGRPRTRSTAHAEHPDPPAP